MREPALPPEPSPLETGLLAASPSDAGAALVASYEELRRIARAALAAEQTGHTLQTTALVHEAWLRLTDSSAVPWHDRRRLLVVAATAMRHVLIDHARRRRAGKRGGGLVPLALDADVAVESARPELLLAVDEALQRLAHVAPRLAQVVELRYFLGLTDAEIAAALGVTTRTVTRDWQKARAWLAAVLSDPAPDSTP
ncbi:MAG TPA: ECF-type sigma factor [Gemmatimonadaceae bacterium]|nr:ECF-type sigma factor [Gemmatimonadaceae bacterium]